MTADRLIIWRHGRTEWNATGRFQGQADVALDELGRSQAEQAAATLAATVRVDRIVASDLSRAYETAQALARRVGVEVETDPRLREIHVGSWQGLTADEVDREDPEFRTSYERGEDVRRSATGETTGEVAERAGNALLEIIHAAADGSTVVAAMHGLAGKVGMCHFLGLPHRTWGTFVGLDNCHWIDLRRGMSEWRLHGYNVGAADTEQAERQVVEGEGAS